MSPEYVTGQTNSHILHIRLQLWILHQVAPIKVHLEFMRALKTAT